MKNIFKTIINKENFLFINKIYLLICYVFLVCLFLVAFLGANAIAVYITVVPCCGWIFLTVVQEVAYAAFLQKGKAVQIVMSAIKNLLLLAFGICIICIGDKLLGIGATLLSLITFAFEFVSIQKRFFKE